MPLRRSHSALSSESVIRTPLSLMDIFVIMVSTLMEPLEWHPQVNVLLVDLLNSVWQVESLENVLLDTSALKRLIHTSLTFPARLTPVHWDLIALRVLKLLLDVLLNSTPSKKVQSNYLSAQTVKLDITVITIN